MLTVHVVLLGVYYVPTPKVLWGDETIYLDSGSTCLELARLLGGRDALTVVTNNLRAIVELAGRGPRLIVIGGELRPLSQAIVGPLSQRIMGTAMRVLGMHGQLGQYGEEVKHAPFHGKFMVWYLKAVSRTFNAGTHEIQLNIIATRGLGLPQG